MNRFGKLPEQVRAKLVGGRDEMRLVQSAKLYFGGGEGV